MKQRLIDGNAMLKHFSVSENGTRYKLKDCDNFPITVNLEYVQKAIRNAPAIDPVHAAGACYCVECKHYVEIYEEQGEGICGRECLFEQPHVRITDFCSYGERKQNEILD